MNAIKVKKADLLVKLRENRSKHKAVFDEAVGGYREKVLEWLEARIAAARKGRVPDMIFNLPQPINQTEDYDRAIAMLEMSVDDIIELEEHDFRQYVQDQWTWTKQVLNINNSYTKIHKL